jgi:hypothetical protein
MPRPSVLALQKQGKVGKPASRGRFETTADSDEDLPRQRARGATGIDQGLLSKKKANLFQHQAEDGKSHAGRNRKLSGEEEEEEIIRLPWRGQCGRAAAGSAALSLRCAASTSANVYTGYA